jgi:hypothetical protein
MVETTHNETITVNTTSHTTDTTAFLINPPASLIPMDTYSTFESTMETAATSFSQQTTEETNRALEQILTFISATGTVTAEALKFKPKVIRKIREFSLYIIHKGIQTNRKFGKLYSTIISNILHHVNQTGITDFALEPC